jgi:hypothetical protein
VIEDPEAVTQVSNDLKTPLESGKAETEILPTRTIRFDQSMVIVPMVA